jgi:hypothetical protein
MSCSGGERVLPCFTRDLFELAKERIACRIAPNRLAEAFRGVPVRGVLQSAAHSRAARKEAQLVEARR